MGRMKPIITEYDEESGEWEIVEDSRSMDELIDEIIEEQSGK